MLLSNFNRQFSIAIFFVIQLFPLFTYSQNIKGNDITGDENFLISQTKQVTQFFRRFNCEEDVSGNALKSTDSLYRNATFRKTYISNLFDNQNPNMSQSLKDAFVDSVLNNKEFLNFYGEKWFAEVGSKFVFKGKTMPMLMFLKLEQENLGYKWVFSNIYFEPFQKLFPHDSLSKKKFIHPMSHELDFMNLNKVFVDAKNIDVYAKKTYSPDYLTLFFYEIKNKNLKFSSIDNVKFHFFQINGWYFELSFVNRKGYNTGWLITNLVRVSNDERLNLMR